MKKVIILTAALLITLVILFPMLKNGRIAKLNKAQANIVVAAALLINVAVLFPPYKAAEFNDKKEITGWHVKWEFNKDLRDLLNPPYFIHPDGTKSFEIWEYRTAHEILWLEIFGILVLAGAGLLITKKRS